MTAYLKALRAPFLTGSLVPVLLAAAWIGLQGASTLKSLLLCFLGVGALHLGANLINDWADSRGSDPINTKVTPFSGGSRVIPDGRLDRRTVLIMSLFFYGVALVVGLSLLRTYPLIGLLGLLGFLIGLFYSVRPLSFMSRGLGEICIFLAFGPLVTLGTAYVLTGHLSWLAFLLGFPQGCLITAVLWINQFPDFQADQAAGKNNLVVRFGPAVARWGYPTLMYGAFICLVILVLLGFSPLVLIGFGALPLAIKACRIFSQHYADHPEIIPAQASTIQTQLAMGVLVSLGLFLARTLM